MKNCEFSWVSTTTKVNFCSKNDCLLQAYLKKIAKIPVLSHKEELELAKLAKNGDKDAKKKLIRANLRLAANIAAKIKNSNMSFSDLLQEANIGLIVAVDKFNYKLGYKFSTYASWWIKQAVLKAISEQSGCMKIPVYVQEIVGKYSKMKSKLENELHMQLSISDMAEKMEIEPKKLEEYVNAFKQNVSLDEKLPNSEKDISLLDVIADEKVSTNEQAEYESLKNALNEAINILKDREKKVVILRFGLNEEPKKTLDEIGQIIGVTKECVRQTELRAIKQLKSLCEQNEIEAYCF